MNMKAWENKVVKAPGAAKRVAEIEDELRLASGLTALRELAGLSQRELAKRLGVSQPRVAAIERSKNVTIEVLEQYVEAVGGSLQVTVLKGNKKIALLSSSNHSTDATPAKQAPRKAAAKKASRRSPVKRLRRSA